MNIRTSNRAGADRVGEHELCSCEPIVGGHGDPSRVPDKIEGEYWSDEYSNFK
jgi:hypothetical protein